MSTSSEIGIVRRMWQQLFGTTHGGERNMSAVFGYPDKLRPENLISLYYRGDIATRIVRAYPKATWRHTPKVRDEAGENRDESDFVAAWEDLIERHGIIRYMERADIVQCQGEFGTLLMGMQDGKPLDQPLTPGSHRLLYLKPYLQAHTQITEWDQDTQSPRFGLPRIYTLNTAASVLGNAPSQGTIRVHHSRIIHIAEHLDQDEVFGAPLLMSIYNRLIDLQKTVGASAENYWLAANRGTAYEIADDMEVDETEKEKIRNQIEEFHDQLRRSLLLKGIKANPISGSIQDGAPIIDNLLTILAGATGIPKRILTGSEQGELASSQDEGNWLARIDERRSNFATPCMIKPFVETMIATGNLPKPKGRSDTNTGWWVEWDEVAGLSETQRAELNERRSNMLRNYTTSPGADLLVPPQEFRTEFLGLEAESEFDLPAFDDLDEEDAEVRDEFERARQNAEPRPLYVCRKVINGEDIVAWAKSQGFVTTLPADQLHVTVTFSRAPVNWMKMGASWSDKPSGQIAVPAGGPRLVEALGDKGAIVLMFSCSELSWRHEDMMREGASWEHSFYQPHITLTYTGHEDLSAVEPYSGPIILGPEIFEDITEDWEQGIAEE